MTARTNTIKLDKEDKKTLRTLERALDWARRASKSRKPVPILRDLALKYDHGSFYSAGLKPATDPFGGDAFVLADCGTNACIAGCAFLIENPKVERRLDSEVCGNKEIGKGALIFIGAVEHIGWTHEIVELREIADIMSSPSAPRPVSRCTKLLAKAMKKCGMKAKFS